jgi:GT2 family glycosyltransferase
MEKEKFSQGKNLLDLSIIIVDFNTKDYLKACLSSIYSKKTSVSFEVIVVDNNSEDGSCSVVRESFPEVILIENLKNVGFARANNQGINIAQGRNILLLNSDTEILDNCLEKIVSFMDKTCDAGIVGCRVLNSDHSLQNSCFKFPTIASEAAFFTLGIIKDYLNPLRNSNKIKNCRMNSPTIVPWVTGCFMCIRREVIEQIGGLDENIFLYYEDTEFCKRALDQSHFKIYYYPSASIIHYHGQSSKKTNFEALAHCFNSSQYILKKFYGTSVVSLYSLLCILIWRFELMILDIASFFAKNSSKISKKQKMIINILKHLKA